RAWGAFDTEGWKEKGLPEIEWHEVAHEPGAEVLTSETWRVTAAPALHAVPAIGLRVEERATGRSVAYSCDTAPTPPITDLARRSDVLVHEATGPMPGNHSSVEEAGQVAAEAGVARLLLVHLPPALTDADLEPARQWFTEVEFGEELGVYAV
ncbi:MAG: MBL fold metallo-hydrolase, partial [Rhodothermales bacterium]|nr:MBL fold metallo-hydrolase [Rhodothermales bacterium]